ncbi:MAG TPA: hypothetical protein VN947_33350 [Polyangia bacterium]|nr:hypothetical protein [Polyangia bacterium]
MPDGSGAGGSGSGGNGSSMPASYGFKNASARDFGGGHYVIVFIIDYPKSSPFAENTEVVRMKWGATTTLSAQFACVSTPWVAPSIQTSPVVSVDLYDNESSGTSVTLPCGDIPETVFLGPEQPLPTQSITLEVDGVFSDATRFAASVDIPIL